MIRLTLPILLLFTVFTSQANQLQEQIKRCEGGDSNSYATGKNKFPANQLLNFDKLTSIAQSNQSIERSLKYLEKKYPKYLEKHTLMYCSDSAQDASFTEPRAIVFGPKGDFVFTFNGGTHQKGGNAFETMEFNKITKEWEFREIAFKRSKEKWDDDISPHEIDRARSSRNIRISKANPQKCTQCHSTDGKRANPNWNDYFFWPCAYGSQDDILYDQFFFHNQETFGKHHYNGNLLSHGFRDSTSAKSQGRLFDLREGVLDKELKGALAYQAGKSSHKRFKHLPDRIADQPIKDLAEGKPFRNDYGERSDYQNNSLATRPNLEMTMNIGSKNQKAIAKDLSSKNGIDNAAKAIAYFQSCGFPTTHNPREDLIKLLGQEKFDKIQSEKGSFESFEKSVFEEELAFQTSRIARAQQVFGENSIDFYSAGGNAKASSGGSPFLGIDNYESTSGFQKVLGRNNFTPRERMAINMESTYLAEQVVIRFLLNSVDIDLSDYAMNFNYGQRQSSWEPSLLSCLGPNLISEIQTKEISCEDIAEDLGTKVHTVQIPESAIQVDNESKY